MRAKTFLEANPSPAIFPLAVSLHGCCTSVVPQNCGGRTRTRRAFPRAINSRDRYQVTVYTTNESSRGWSRTSGLRVQSPAFVPTQTTREKDKLPRQESNLESAGSEPAALANYTTGHPISTSAKPDVGIEPTTQPWRGRVMAPSPIGQNSVQQKTPKPFAGFGAVASFKSSSAPYPLRSFCWLPPALAAAAVWSNWANA